MSYTPCVNCDKHVKFVKSLGYWYHPDGNKTWCYNPEDGSIPADRRNLLAQPVVDYLGWPVVRYEANE